MSKHPPVSASVERWIDAPPEVIYDLVSDITRMGEWSPETVRAEWLGGATHAVPGARFKGFNELGPNAWSTKPEIVTADRGRCFSFRVPGRSGPTWTYDFHREGEATRVVESVRQDVRSPLLIRLLQKRAGVTDRSASLIAGMTTTLERLETSAAAVASH